MEHVLVTGAAGMIGRATTNHLRSLGHAVTALVLDDPGDLKVDRVVVGNAGDRAAVEEALDGVEAVIHLAAIPAPVLGTANEVFAGNTAATFTVLDAAGQRGIRRAAIASSINALGYGWSPLRRPCPEYLPLDEDLPTQAADPYSLSKVADEATAAAMHRRYGMTVVALRLPFVGSLSTDDGGDGRLPAHAAAVTANAEVGARDLWLYLETRDAARAMEHALRVSEAGAHVAFVAAPRSIAPYSTEDLLDLYYPDVPRRRPMPGRTAPVDLTQAERILDFTAIHLLPDSDEVRTLPAGLRTEEDVMTVTRTTPDSRTAETTQVLAADAPAFENVKPPWEPRDGLRITGVRAIATAPGGTPLVIVRVDTNEPGLYGLGCATFTQRWHSVVAYVEQHLERLVVGRHPADIEDIIRAVHYGS
nr:NAD(P)-dependent oxidoreductase [Jiangella gansuensis]